MTSSIAAVALALQLHREIARVGFGHRGEPELQAGAAGRAFHFRRLGENLLHAQQHLVGVGERRSGGHQVIENEAALVHRRQQIAAERVVAEVRRHDQHDAAAGQHQRIGQSEPQRPLVERASAGP